jgi:hypothetical protein
MAFADVIGQSQKEIFRVRAEKRLPQQEYLDDESSPAIALLFRLGRFAALPVSAIVHLHGREHPLLPAWTRRPTKLRMLKGALTTI